MPELLSIPAEVRIHIYRSLLEACPVAIRATNSRLYTGYSNYSFPPNILATNRQIHDEATPILYGENLFIIDASLRKNLSMAPLMPILPYLRRLHVRFSMSSAIFKDASYHRDMTQLQDNLNIICGAITDDTSVRCVQISWTENADTPLNLMTGPLSDNVLAKALLCDP